MRASGAAPIAGGAAALIHKVNPALGPQGILDVLAMTAQPGRADDPEKARLGAGRINLPRAVAFARALRERHVPVRDADVSELVKVSSAPRYEEMAREAETCAEYQRGVESIYLSRQEGARRFLRRARHGTQRSPLLAPSG
jgi:hypothetical protein